jgi:hypothetical protein
MLIPQSTVIDLAQKPCAPRATRHFSTMARRRQREPRCLEDRPADLLSCPLEFASSWLDAWRAQCRWQPGAASEARDDVQRSALGHVWTAPWQELSDVYAALVGCGHVSGLLVRQVWPLALMLCADRVPNKLAHFGRGALTQAGSPDPRNDRICITSSCPRQLVLPI